MSNIFNFNLDNKDIIKQISTLKKQDQVDIYYIDSDEKAIKFTVIINNSKKVVFKKISDGKIINIKITDSSSIVNQIKNTEKISKIVYRDNKDKDEDPSKSIISINKPVYIDDIKSHGHISLQDDMVSHLSEIIKTEQYYTSEINIELNKYEQKLTDSEKKDRVYELLSDLYDKIIPTKLYKSSEYFVNLINNVEENKSYNTNLSHKPFLDKILNNKYSDTNLYPIVLDKQKMYDVNIDIDTNNEIYQKFNFLNFTDELKITYELNNKLYSNSGQNANYKYRDRIKDLYNGGSIDDTPFDPIHLNFLELDDMNIKVPYYKTTIPYETTVYRNCTLDNKCVTLDISNKSKGIKEIPIYISKRKTVKSQYILEDHYDNIFISDKKGTVKSKIVICNGTNKTGDNFYYNNDKVSELLKVQSIPPTQKCIFEGESLLISGIYIQSPYFKEQRIIHANEYVDHTTKTYPKLYSNSLNIFSQQINTDNDNVVIINNYNDFSYDNYDNTKDYIVLFNPEENKRVISSKEYNEIIIPHLLPSIGDILLIEKESLSKCTSIKEIDAIINRYGLEFNDLNKLALNTLQVNSNIDNIIKCNHYLKVKYLDDKNISSIFNDIYNKLYIKIIELKKSSISEEEKESLFKLSILNLFNEYENVEFMIRFCKIVLKINPPSTLSKTEFYNLIYTFFLKLSNNNIFTQFYDIPKQLFTKYIESNKFKNVSINILTNYKNELAPLNILYQKNDKLFNGSELNNIMKLNNLLQIKSILDEEIKNKSIYDINQETIHYITQQFEELKNTYESNRKRYKFFIQNCNNVKISKIYKELKEVLADNHTTTYVDVEFDNTLILLNAYHDTLMEINKNVTHKDEVISNAEDENVYNTKIFKNVSYLLPYLTDKEINSEITRLNDMVNDKDDDYYNMLDILNNRNKEIKDKIIDIRKINLTRFGNKIIPLNYCILYTEGKRYIFHRVGNVWVSADKEFIDNIAPAFDCLNYDQSILDFDYDTFYNICTVSKNKSPEIKQHCFEIDNYKLPGNVYYHFEKQRKLKEQLSTYSHLLEFKKSMDENIDDLTKDVLNKINHVSKNDMLRTYDNYEDNTSVAKLIKPNNKIKKEYNEIFKILDFDLRMDSLFKFIQKYGIEYSRKIYKHNKDDPEGDMATSKWVYYDSDIIDTPICCKHYLDYKDLIFKDNSTRQKILQHVKSKWGVGKTEGKYHLCSNCGEPLDYIKYSEFEGFGNDNKVINVREEILDSDELYLEIMLETNKIKELLKFLTNLIGIKLNISDEEFIEANLKNLDTNNVTWEEGYHILRTEYSHLYEKMFVKYKDECKSRFLKSKSKKSFDSTEYDKSFKYYIEIFFSTFRISGTFKASKQEKEMEKKKWKSYMDQETNPTIKNYVGIGLIKFIQDGLIHFLMKFKSFYLIINLISYLSQILIYSSTNYRIIGTNTERSDKKGLILYDLYKNKNQAYELLYNKIKGHIGPPHPWIKNKNTSVVNEELKKYNEFITTAVVKIDDYNKTILAIIENNIPNTHKNVYMSNLISNKNQIEASNILEQETKNEYEWLLFLPYLNSNTDNKNITFNNIESTIKEFESNYTSLIKKYNKKKYTRNQEIKIILSNTQDKLALLYMNIINNYIDLEEQHNIKISQYTSSVAYDSIYNNYIEYFIKKDRSVADIILDMERICFIFKKYTDNIKLGNFIISKNDHTVRDLQEYTNINVLYDDEDDIDKNTIINKLINIHMSINKLDVSHMNKKRHFKYISDNDYYLLGEILNENPDIKIDSDELKSLLNKKLLDKYGDSSMNKFKSELISNNKSIGYIDIVSGKFKHEIKNILLDKYESLSIRDLKLELNTLTKEFFSSIIYLNKYAINPQYNIYNSKELIEQRDLIILSNYNNLFKYLEPILVNDIFETPVFSNFKSDMDTLYSNNLNNKNQLNLSIIKKLDQYCNIDPYLEKISKFIDTQIFVNNDAMNEQTEELLSKLEKQLIIENIMGQYKDTELLYRKNKIELDKDISTLNIFLNILNTVIVAYNRLNNSSFTVKSCDDILSNMQLDRDNDNRLIQSILQPRIDIIKDNLADKSQLLSETEPDINIFDYINFINNISVNDFMINVKGETNGVNLMMSSYITKFISLFIVTILNSIQMKANDSFMTSVIEDIENIIFINNTTDSDIMHIIKMKRANENITRKKRFEDMTDDRKYSQKLYRRFNIGELFNMDDINLNLDNDLFQGVDLAANDRNSSNDPEVNDDQNALFDQESEQANIITEFEDTRLSNDDLFVNDDETL